MITRKPPKIFPAFNPAILEYTDLFNDYDESDEEHIYVRIYEKAYDNDYEYVQIRRQLLNKKFTFNISDAVKKAFTYEKNTGELIADNYLRKHVVLPAGQGIISDEYYCVVNAVESIGKSTDYLPQAGSFRTRFDKIILYQGFERTITILGFEELTSIVFDDNETIVNYSGYDLFSLRIPEKCSVIKINTQLYTLPLTDNFDEPITDNAEINIRVRSYNNGLIRSIPVETRPVPENPFYTRWINQQGGWDYWMFSHRQTIENKISGQKTYHPVITDNEHAAATTLEYFKEAESIITVGAEGLTDNDFHCISRLIYSPCIEYYSQPARKWIRTVIDKGEIEQDTRSSAHTVEFTFHLPTPQIQI